MGPSMGGFNPVASDLPDICQVSVPPGRAKLILVWLSFWLGLAISDLKCRSTLAGAYEWFQLEITQCFSLLRKLLSFLDCFCFVGHQLVHICCDDQSTSSPMDYATDTGGEKARL